MAWALGLSIVIHLLLLGTYQTGKKLDWWQKWRAPAWVQSAKMLTHLLQKPAKARTPTEREPPLLFVEVLPSQETPTAPEDAKYYSDRNSQAANPEATLETDLPKIEGTQEHVVKTVDVPRQEITRLQPSLPVPSATQEQEEVRARPAQPPGDLTMARPEPKPRTDTGKAPRPKPRTVKEALARLNEGRIAGEKMKQEGGVARRLESASLSAKATSYGAYDAALIAAIQQRWYHLLDERDYASDSRGKVVLQFILHYDGRVSEMTVAENSAGEMLALICEKAVLDPAPFAPWTMEMRRLLGETRNIQFTFYYD